jgi:hypothetical protein
VWEYQRGLSQREVFGLAGLTKEEHSLARGAKVP